MTDERTTRKPSTVTEAVATAKTTAGSTCSSDEFQCGDGACIPLSQRCDWTEYHCQDGTDEFDCRTFVLFSIYTVSQKRDPDIIDCKVKTG